MCHPAVIPLLASAGGAVAGGAAAVGGAIASGAAAVGGAVASGASAVAGAVSSGASAVGSFLGGGAGAGAGGAAATGGVSSATTSAFLTGGPGGLGTALSTSASSGGLIGGASAGGGILSALQSPGGLGKALEFGGSVSSLLGGASNAASNAQLARFNAKQHKFTIRDARRAQELEAVAFGTEARLRQSRIRATAAARGLDPNSAGVAGNILTADQRATERTRNLMRERAAMEIYQLRLRKRIGIYEAEVGAVQQSQASIDGIFQLAASQAQQGSFLSGIL